MCRNAMIVAIALIAVLAVGSPSFAEDTQVQGMNAELNQAVGGTIFNKSPVSADADAAAKAKAAADAQSASSSSSGVENSGNSSNSNVNSNDSGGGTAVGIVSLNQNFPKSDKPNMQAPGNYPPYLGMWTHGGWGTLRAYFPNGPASDTAVYERQFNPSDPDDMKDLRGVISGMPHKGPLEVLGAIFTDSYLGRGVKSLGNSLVRNRRPRGKPLAVINITGVEKGFLKDNGYAYVGMVSMEGDADRNWDQTYDCMVWEALKWDVDIVLVSGGMKGITTGSTDSTGGAGAGGQPNYSFSVFGAGSKGVTEPKGKAMVSGEGYRLDPKFVARRGIKVGHYSDLVALRTKAAEEAIARAQKAEAEAEAAEANAQARADAEATARATRENAIFTLLETEVKMLNKKQNGEKQNGNDDKKKEWQQLQSKPPVR